MDARVPMWVGAARISFHLAEARSLKERRRVASRVRDRVLARFDVAVAVLGPPDVPQRLEMGFAAVGNDPAVLRAALDKTLAYVDELYIAPVWDREVVVERFSGHRNR